jgi:hypothetical protein
MMSLSDQTSSELESLHSHSSRSHPAMQQAAQAASETRASTTCIPVQGIGAATWIRTTTFIIDAVQELVTVSSPALSYGRS